MLEMANLRLFGFWSHLTEALRDRQAAERGEGRRAVFFAALYADPARLRLPRRR